MAVPHNKQALLDAILLNYRRLATDLATVPPARAREATLPGHAAGTLMSVADLVAYLLGWQLLVLKWCEAGDKGLHADLPETGYKWNELGRLAQKFYADHAHLPYPALLRQFDDAHARIVARVERESNATLYGTPWYGKHTLGRMIQLNTSSPYANARTRLRQWMKNQGL